MNRWIKWSLLALFSVLMLFNIYSVLAEDYSSCSYMEGSAGWGCYCWTKGSNDIPNIIVGYTEATCFPENVNYNAESISGSSTLVKPSELSDVEIEDGEDFRYIGAVLFDFYNLNIQYDIYPDPSAYPAKYQQAYCKGQTKYFTPNGTGNYDAGSQCTTDKTASSTKLIYPGGNTTTPATSKDLQMANATIGTLVQEMNNALEFIRTRNYDATYGSLIDVYKEIAACPTSGSVKLIKCEVGNSNYKDGSLDNLYDGHITSSNYVVLTDKMNPDDKTVLLWKLPKKVGEETIEITWMDIFEFANAAYNSGHTADMQAEGKGFSAFYRQSEAGKLLKEFSEVHFATLTTEKLGLSSVEEIILNRNNRDYAYYLGLMPYQWWNIGNAMFWFFEIVGIFILLASIFYMVYKQNYAIISPIERLQMQDMIANILMSILFMIIYIPVFFIIAKSNHIVVKALDDFVAGRNLVYAEAKASGLSGSIAMIFWGMALLFINFFIVIRINLTYLTRSITILALHMIAPAAIATMGFQGRGRGTIFNTWFRELISAILMQAFDAMILVLYIMITNYGSGLNGLQSQFLCFTFIPLNDFFKSRLTGTSGVANVANEAFQNVSTGAQRATGFAGKTTNLLTGLASAGAKMLGANGVAAATDAAGQAISSAMDAGGAGNTGQTGGKVGQNSEKGKETPEDDTENVAGEVEGKKEEMKKSGDPIAKEKVKDLSSEKAKRFAGTALDMGLVIGGALMDFSTMSFMDTNFAGTAQSIANSDMETRNSISKIESNRDTEIAKIESDNQKHNETIQNIQARTQSFNNMTTQFKGMRSDMQVQTDAARTTILANEATINSMNAQTAVDAQTARLIAAEAERLELDNRVRSTQVSNQENQSAPGGRTKKASHGGVPNSVPTRKHQKTKRHV